MCGLSDKIQSAYDIVIPEELTLNEDISKALISEDNFIQYPLVSVVVVATKKYGVESSVNTPNPPSLPLVINAVLEVDMELSAPITTLFVPPAEADEPIATEFPFE